MKLSRKQLEQLISDAVPDQRGQNLYGTCPFCGHNEFGISIVKEHNPFQCFRKKECGQQGWVYKILKHLGKVKEFLGEREIDIFGKLDNTLSSFVEVDLQLPQVSPPILWQRLYDDPYLRKRGFTDDQFHKFEVGRSKLKKDYVTFLVRTNGIVTGYIGRSDKSKEWIDNYNQDRDDDKKYLRYNNSTSDFAKMLFGYDEIVEGVTEDVILTEGIFSKTKTDSNLQLDDQQWIKCCATFGAKLSDEQIELLKLKRVKRLVFWFEADVLDKIKTTIAKASNFFQVKASYIKDKDPNDLNQLEAIQLLESAQDWLEFNTGYIKSSLKL